MKVKDKATAYKFDEVTEANIKEIARRLEYSETDVLKTLVNQYFKMQTIKHYDDDENLIGVEYIPFYETRESYQQLKDDYIREFDAKEYPARMARAED
jgi:hypothetical protein